MGFYAAKSAVPAGRLREDCLEFLKQFADVRIRLATPEWITPRS
jgi:hypothetical protein